VRTSRSHLLGSHLRKATDRPRPPGHSRPIDRSLIWVLFVAPGATIHIDPEVRFAVDLMVFLAALAALVRRRRRVLRRDGDRLRAQPGADERVEPVNRGRVRLHSGGGAHRERDTGVDTSSTDAHQQSLGLERSIFLSDAVFAIVITLLVLPLTAEIELLDEGQHLIGHAWAQWPRVLSFLVSFLVIGQFWIAHHHMFEFVRRDRGLLWFNLVSLLTVSFMPFPTALLGARLDTDDWFRSCSTRPA